MERIVIMCDGGCGRECIKNDAEHRGWFSVTLFVNRDKNAKSPIDICSWECLNRYAVKRANENG